MNPTNFQNGHGVITAVYGVTNGKGPASGISYDAQICTPTGPVNVAGIVPTHLRPPDVVDTVAAKVGHMIDWACLNGTYWYSIREFEDMAVCS